MQVLLKVTHGPHRGRTFSFDTHDTFIVGRGKSAHFQLPKLDGHFSRNHFMLEVNPPHCLLVDMDSRNGTYVNAKRVEQAILQDGDLIQGGKTAIRVTIKQDNEAPVAAPHSPPPASPTQDRQPPPWAPRTPVEEQPAAPLPEPTEHFAPATQSSHAPPQEYLEKIESQPQTIPGYKIIEQLGQGGMGSVFLAWWEAKGKLVALKMIMPDAAPQARHTARDSSAKPNSFATSAIPTSSPMKTPVWPTIPSISPWSTSRGRTFVSCSPKNNGPLPDRPGRPPRLPNTRSSRRRPLARHRPP